MQDERSIYARRSSRVIISVSRRFGNTRTNLLGLYTKLHYQSVGIR